MAQEDAPGRAETVPWGRTNSLAHRKQSCHFLVTVFIVYRTSKTLASYPWPLPRLRRHGCCACEWPGIKEQKATVNGTRRCVYLGHPGYMTGLSCFLVRGSPFSSLGPGKPKGGRVLRCYGALKNQTVSHPSPASMDHSPSSVQRHWRGRLGRREVLRQARIC